MSKMKKSFKFIYHGNKYDVSFFHQILKNYSSITTNYMNSKSYPFFFIDFIDLKAACNRQGVFIILNIIIY